MSNQRDLERPSTGTAAGPADAGGTAGKSTLTGRIQRKGDAAATGDASAAVAGLGSGGGAPLPAAQRQQFEGSLGADLSGVRVHTGADSAGAAEQLGARAFTTGQDVHFGAGQYRPDDPYGMHLLAHEVAHTVQQGGGGAAQAKLEVSAPDDPLEHEADRAADAMVSGAPASVSAGSVVAARKVHRAMAPGAHEGAGGGRGGQGTGGSRGSQGGGNGTVTVLRGGSGGVRAATATSAAAELTPEEIQMTFDAALPIWRDHVKEDFSIELDFQVYPSGSVAVVKATKSVPEDLRTREELRLLAELLVFPKPKQQREGADEMAYFGVQIMIPAKRDY